MTYLKESIFGTLDEKYDYQVDLRMPPDSNNEKSRMRCKMEILGIWIGTSNSAEARYEREIIKESL